jgi:ABC-type multidrug transport system ATPase subunit
MRTIATLQEADSGTVFLGETDVLKDKQKIREVLGYLPQEFGVYPRVSAYEMLDHIAVLKGVTSKSERKELVSGLLERVNLSQHKNKSISGFSGGMKQRFGIAQSLIGNPKLIIVDEPTAGLDPGERNRFYNLLSEIGENVIVILSTHIVQDVRELCPMMAIIDKGKLLYSGKPDDALHSMQGKIWEKSISKEEMDQYQQQHEVISSKLVSGKPLIHIYSETRPDGGFEPADADLEDVFFKTIR